MEIRSLSMTEQPLWFFMSRPEQDVVAGSNGATLMPLWHISTLVAVSHLAPAPLICRPGQKGLKEAPEVAEGSGNSAVLTVWSFRPWHFLPGILWRQQGWWKTRGGYQTIASLNTFPCPAGFCALEKQSELSRYKHKIIQKELKLCWIDENKKIRSECISCHHFLRETSKQPDGSGDGKGLGGYFIFWSRCAWGAVFLGCRACRTVAASARLSWVCGLQRIWGSSPGNLVCLGKSSPCAWGQVQLASTGGEDMGCLSTLSVPTSGEEMYLPNKLFLLSTWQFSYGLLMPAIVGKAHFCFCPPQTMK